MLPPAHLRPKRSRVGLGLCLLALLASCNLLQKKSGKTAGGGRLIVTGSIYIDRLGAGDSARVKFKTSEMALCELAFYAQDTSSQPTLAKPTVVPCQSATQAQTDFVEKLPGLRSDTLYYVIITAWTPAAGRRGADILTVRETPDNPSLVTGDGTAAFKELLVARFDVPLMSAEVHRHVPPAPIDVPTIKANLTRKLGCQQGFPPNDAPFRTAAADVGIKNLVTRDFAAADAKPSANHPERLHLAYDSMNNTMNQWTILYRSADKDLVVPVQPISQILNMEMESANIMSFEAPQLAKSPDPFKIDATKPLKLSWTTGNNLLDLSYMSVQIGRPDYDKSIYCVFAASKGVGVIDPPFLQNLDDGDQVVLAELASNQLWVKDGWLFTVYDWRSGRIEK